MSNILYCRGYYLTNRNVEVLPDSFNKLVLDNEFVFYYHNWLDVAICRNQKDFVVVAGLCLDLLSENSDNYLIASRLLSELIYNGEDAFHDYIDHLSGTYILITSHNSNMKIYTDACAMKSVFYTDISVYPLVISSHLEMILDFSGIKRELSDIYRNKPKHISYEYGYPGITTKYKDIRQLLPNVYLDVRKNKIIRYFPRKDLIVNNCIEDIAESLVVQLQKQFKLLQEKNYEQILLSVTAGQDSRCTLASLRPFWDDISFFTYNLDGKHEKDIIVSKDIVQRLGIKNYNELILTSKNCESTDFLEFCNILNRNTIYNHGKKIAFFYKNKLSSFYRPNNSLHIRSNLAEIGRLYYGIFAYYWEMTANNATVLDKVLRAYHPYAQNEEEVKNAFIEFIETHNFLSLKNYDVFDMFYWEHRMGIWMSQVLIEGDPAFETINLYNCRDILKKMLSVPLKDRFNNLVFLKIINERLPELEDLAIN
ncbi:hypothetical protein MMG00_06400 [Ignatzschineria rhizosphaerae]|uniref:Asparagine synthetase domain-containing protein n=1 Tax=Ignatzschineria rhizosphaerae TaxID=2923279 RepID=A0ABY3X3J6_9GAMM|nr:hypothetical protein [Ignatzschineria rhizosphaerae]UNM97468.1 hypothetical protein MMG00_06400 [Ignatzschineria rhizosphaerae]